jgi:hypothetical protein
MKATLHKEEYCATNEKEESEVWKRKKGIWPWGALVLAHWATVPEPPVVLVLMQKLPACVRACVNCGV